MRNIERKEGPPETPLERIADAMLDTGEALTQEMGVQMIVLLDSPEVGQIAMRGYPNDLEAVTAMFMHLKAILNANGKDIGLLPLGRG